MPSSIMYENEETFVVLETNEPEKYLTAEELVEKVRLILLSGEYQLTPDLSRFSNVDDQARYLVNTYCELDVGPGNFLEWYVIRLNNED